MKETELIPIETLMPGYIDRLFASFVKKQYVTVTVNIPLARYMCHSRYARVFDTYRRTKKEENLWDSIFAWNIVLNQKVFEFNFKRPYDQGHCQAIMFPGSGTNHFKIVLMLLEEDGKISTSRLNFKEPCV